MVFNFFSQMGKCSKLYFVTKYRLLFEKRYQFTLYYTLFTRETVEVGRFYFYIYKNALLCKITRAWYYLVNDELKLSKLCTLTITVSSFHFVPPKFQQLVGFFQCFAINVVEK